MRSVRDLALPAALAALTAATLSATPARAQGRDPRVRDVTVNGVSSRKGPLGCVVVVLGTDFHVCPEKAEDEEPCRHEEVSVEFGSAECPVLDASAEMVQFIIPQFDVDPGQETVEVEVGDRSVEFQFEAVPPEEYDRSEQGGENNQPGMGPGRPEQIRQQFSITRFDLARDGGANRFEIEGLAGDLPDGFSVAAVLKFDGREIAGRKAEITGGGFDVVFGPFTKQLLFGNYSVTLLFELGKQSRLRSRRFVRTLTEEERDVYERIERREFLKVGTTAEIEEQEEELQDHYLQFTKDAEDLLGEFESAFACASRTFFKPQGGASYDEQEYSAYLQRMDFAETADDLERIKRDTRFAHASGHFKGKEYQAWAEDELLPQLTELYERQVAFKNRYIAALDERADLLCDYLVSIVLGLFQDWSQKLYRQTDVEAPESISDAPIDPISAPTMSKSFFHAQRRLLLRRVGLDDVVEAEDEASGEDEG